MMGSLFFILTLIWTLGLEKFNVYILTQLIFAIPLLFISSLFYTKAGYKDKVFLFDKAGWISTTIGNIFILNVVGLIAGTFSKNIALIYFVLTSICILSYYTIGVYYERETFKEKIIKVLFIFIILTLGGIYPLFLI